MSRKFGWGINKDCYRKQDRELEPMLTSRQSFSCSHLLHNLVIDIIQLLWEQTEGELLFKVRTMVSCLRHQCKNIFQTHLRPATVVYPCCLYLLVWSLDITIKSHANYGTKGSIRNEPFLQLLLSVPEFHLVPMHCNTFNLCSNPLLRWTYG